MSEHSRGIHHITVISGDAQRNAAFYVRSLGLRMVLKTVNQDDPRTHHLFYANGSGKPGSSITFFPWAGAAQSKQGTGEAISIQFTVPENSMDFWGKHLENEGVPVLGQRNIFDFEALRFTDPDGLRLELVFDPAADNLPAWSESTVPEEFGIRGFWGTTLRLTDVDATGDILENILGFRRKETDSNLLLFQTDSLIGHSVILEKADEKEAGKSGRGTVHHVAFRVKDEEEQLELRRKVIGTGLMPTGVVDRHVFKSVYFQSPGGVLFEIATDGPGYSSVVVDESEIGQSLFLPSWLEEHRKSIEERLPVISV